VEDGGGVSQQSRRRVQLQDTAGVQNHHPGSTTKLHVASSMAVADPGFDLRGGVDFVNGGGGGK